MKFTHKGIEYEEGEKVEFQNPLDKKWYPGTIGFDPMYLFFFDPESEQLEFFIEEDHILRKIEE